MTRNAFEYAPLVPGSLATQCPGLLCPPGVLPRVGTTSRVASEGVTPPSSLL
jgi:hypothetical protein